MTTSTGPRARITPSFVVATLALVAASGGAGYAAGQVTSAQIKDGTIQSRDVADRTLGGVDVRDGSLTGADLRNGSVARAKLDHRCDTGQAKLFGGCVPLRSWGPSSHQAAIDDCSRRGGRLPTTLEVRWIATHDEFTWADGNSGNYEFTADYTAEYPLTPIGIDQLGFTVQNSSGQLFWHHCVVD
ncbi:hypothetical protein [Nocardioides marinquilinus]